MGAGVAVAHWRAVASVADQKKLLWIVVRHEIDYKQAAHLGDSVLARTWIGVATRIKFERHTELLRESDGVVLAKGAYRVVPHRRDHRQIGEREYGSAGPVLRGAVKRLGGVQIGTDASGVYASIETSFARVRQNVILRETAEVPAIVFAELRVALISDSEACLTDVDRVDEQALPRLLKTDAPLILNRRHAGNGFEVLVE